LNIHWERLKSRKTFVPTQSSVEEFGAIDSKIIMPIEKVLPVGVGRVPSWWMEITPHHTLDEEEEVERRKAEDQMAFYYMQLAAADDAAVLLPDGTPKLGPDLKPLAWTPITPWNKLDPKDEGSSTCLGPGGRNFKPGHPVIDPKLFGIQETDPDYQSYLTGAKLPPGYFEKMGELAQSELGGTEGILNNLRQTDYGRYGRQAEAPSFKPAWAKKKLRSTETGASIRQGQYNDSPNKFINHRRRVEANDAMPKLVVVVPSTEASIDSVTSKQNVPITAIQDQIKSVHIAPVASNNEQNDVDKAKRSAGSPSAIDEKKKMVRKVRKVRKKESTPTSTFSEKDSIPRCTKASTHPTSAATATLLDQEPQLSELTELQEKLQRLQGLQKQPQMLREQEERNVISEHSAVVASLQEFDDEDSYEEEIIEEYYDDDECTEGSYVEEVIFEEEEDDGLQLTDLQAILAAKQAELQRLTQQLQ
jgi:hypothetical protein